MVFWAMGFFPLIVNAASEPTVTTRNANYITSANATLNGSVDGNNDSTRAWFEYGTTRSMNETTPRKSTGDDYENFNIDLDNLRENTIYYFRAVARNSEGTDYGNIFSFRTAPSNNNYYNYPNINYSNYAYYDYPNDPQYYNQPTNSTIPTAITEPASKIAGNSVELNSLILTSINNPTRSWFEWGRTQNLGYKTEALFLGTSPSTRHVHTLSGLSPNTTYYFRAVAENSYFRNIGSILSFRTNANFANTNTVIIIEEPVETRTTVIQEVPPTKPVEVKTSELVAPLGATALVGSPFFPGNIIEWSILIILVLILIMLVKPYANK